MRRIQQTTAHRAPMADAIDLTFSSDEGDAPMPAPPAGPVSEEERRKQIMLFAKNVAAKRHKADHQAPADGGAGGSQQQKGEEGGAGPSSSGAGPSGSGGAGPSGSQPGSGGGNNSLLAQLHAERLARMQRAPGGGGGGEAAGAAGDAKKPPLQSTSRDVAPPSPERRQGGGGAKRKASSPPPAAGRAPGAKAGSGAAGPRDQPPRKVSLLQYNVVSRLSPG